MNLNEKKTNISNLALTIRAAINSDKVRRKRNELMNLINTADSDIEITEAHFAETER